MIRIPTLILFFSITFIYPQDSKMYNIIEGVSAERIESDITKLVSFGTRHTPVSYTHLTLPTILLV